MLDTGWTAEGGFCPFEHKPFANGWSDFSLLSLASQSLVPASGCRYSLSPAVPANLAQVQDEAVPGVEAVPAQRPLGGTDVLLPLHLVQLLDGSWNGPGRGLVKR